MNDPNAIKGSASSSIPKWLAKTHARYDADDVAFTPPEDGTHFFSLHLAVSEESAAAPLHKSTYDKINEELGYAENCAGGRRLSLGGKTNSPRRSSGLCLSAELQNHSQDQRIESIISDDQQKYAVKPLLVIPRVFSADPATRSPDRKHPSDQSKFAASADDPHSDTEHVPEFVLEEGDAKKSEHSVERANRTVQLGKDIRDLKQEFKAEEGAYNIVDSVRNLFYGKPGSDGQKSLEASSQAIRKISCPQFGQGLKEFKREETQYISSQGLVLERRAPVCNSFFYRPGEAAVSKSGSETPPTVPESVASDSQTQLSTTEREIAAQAAAAATVSEKVRRPRPSRLREMNFWAPTSM
ncbi:hypothetical protein FHG87_013950 [Trinorchestia longiramus]|nr:hypothetical protein FHG87_013950 [Trinorchestia longiramus]